jgi:hypothetical protein
LVVVKDEGETRVGSKEAVAGVPADAPAAAARLYSLLFFLFFFLPDTAG